MVLVDASVVRASFAAFGGLCGAVLARFFGNDAEGFLAVWSGPLDLLVGPEAEAVGVEEIRGVARSLVADNILAEHPDGRYSLRLDEESLRAMMASGGPDRAGR